ncbi:MAG: anti-sigma factor [Streptosporangiaceae bacterium]|nr:anti-sigma factor [Streptosporangiaceae bacterium]
MSDLRLIEEMCAAVPAPDAERLAALRARVMEEALPGPHRVLRGDVWRGLRRVARWPRLGLTLAGGVAAILAVVLVLALGGGAVAPPASAAELLSRAAGAVLAQPAPADRQLIYSDTTFYYATYAGHSSRPAGHVLVRQQEWQSPVSTDAFYRASPCYIDGTPGDVPGKAAACNFQGGYAPGATAYSTYAGLRTLPTSAGPLLSYLATLPGPDGVSQAERRWSAANLVAQLNPVLPPGFGAALFRALARIPGTVLLPHASDAAGARGIGIARTGSGMTEELLFDPVSYQLIGQQTTVLARQGSAAYVSVASVLHQYKFSRTGPGAGSATGGSYVYTSTRVVSLLPSVRGDHLARWTTYRGSQEMWQSADGSWPGVFRISPCHPGASCELVIPPGTGTAELPSYTALTALPLDPRRLASYLLRSSACSSAMSAASREWAAVSLMLGGEQALPPGLSTALFRVAAAIPGAVVLPDVRDAAGGGGIAVVRNETPALRMELIFTPGTHQFIGVQEILTRSFDGARAGTVWAASALTGTKIVNSAPVSAPGGSYDPPSCSYSPGFFASSSSSSSPSASSSPVSGSSSSEAAP